MQTLFDAPNGSNPVALNLDKMGKGQLWVNGFNLGRYWPSLISQQDNCPSTCDYRGVYTESKCLSQCSQPSQQWLVAFLLLLHRMLIDFMPIISRADL